MLTYNKPLILLFAFLSCIQCSFSQFKKALGGNSFESKAIIEFSGYSESGGGVILKGKSRPGKKDSAVVFLGAGFENLADSNTRLIFKTSSGDMTYSNRSGLIKDAIAFVKEEKVWTRDVNLLGRPSPSDLVDSLDYPDSGYFYVEMNKQLIGHKTGEQLLLADILLTDPDFYADESAKESGLDDRYTQLVDSLQTESMFDFYETYIVRQFDALNTSKMNGQDSLKYFYIRVYLDSYYEKLARESRMWDVLDWTYNDEFSDYRFAADPASHSLWLYGEPQFTFLSFGKKYVLVTNYFLDHKSIIKGLNPHVFKYVDDFARLSAFFRYLRDNNPDTWAAVVGFAPKIPFENGNTPRIISKK